MGKERESTISTELQVPSTCKSINQLAQIKVYQCLFCFEKSHICEDLSATMAETNFTNIKREPVCLISPDFEDDLCPSSVKPIRVVLAVVNGVASPPTFVVNLLIIWSILENKNLRLNSYSILLVGLAVSDLLVGLLTEPAVAWYIGCWAMNCQISCSFTVLFITAVICFSLSISTLMMVSVERYLAIQHPFFHQQSITSKRMTFGTAIACIITLTSFLVVRLTLTNSALKKIPALLILISHILVILYCTVTVQIAAYRQRKSMITQLVAVQTNNQDFGNSKQAQELKARLQEHKRVFTMFILVLVTFVCYCPFIITTIIETVHGKDVTKDFKYIAQVIHTTFINLQSLVNPLIVSLRMSNIRASVKKKLLYCTCVNRVEPQQDPSDPPRGA